MQLDGEWRELIGRARIGMLALSGGRLPLVNPAAFYLSAGSIWMTTSRRAVKLLLASRDPRAAFLVEMRGRGVLFQGTLDVYDLRSARDQLRAAIDLPRFAASMAGYTWKNAAFVGGYLLDLAGTPGDWWPHNRVVLRIRPHRVRGMTTGDVPDARPAPVPGAPAEVAKAVGRARTGHLCWGTGTPLLAPALWAADGDDVVAWLPAAAPGPPPLHGPAALVVERHHAFRASRMLGACLRGTADADEGALGVLGQRYDRLPAEGTPLRIRVERTTWWRGFEVHTTPVGIAAGVG